MPKGSWVYEEVAGLARDLTDLGCDIVTGGGPGPDAGRQRGRREGRAGAAESVGVRVELPFEQSVNPFVEQAFEHRTFFTRLHQFVLMSDAFVVVPGGVGTALELLMVWQLLQVRHIEERTPLILIGKMYADLVAWARGSMLDPSSRWPPRGHGHPALREHRGRGDRRDTEAPGILAQGPALVYPTLVAGAQPRAASPSSTESGNRLRRPLRIDPDHAFVGARVLQDLELAGKQGSRHVVTATPGQPLFQGVAVHRHVHEHDAFWSCEPFPVGPLQRRAGDHPAFAGGQPPFDPGRDAIQPRPPVLVGQRDSRAHLRDIRRRMKIVAFLEGPA